MIKETEVKEILKKNIPELHIATEQLNSLYKTIENFAIYTKELIKQGNLPLVLQSFDTAEYLLKEGTQNIKLAIDNIYVYSVAAFIDLTGSASRQVKEL